MSRSSRVTVALAAALLFFVSSAPANAQIAWTSQPDPNAPALGGCWGNCGAGCTGELWGGFPAPCGGAHQWTLTIIGFPWATGQVVEDAPFCGPIYNIYPQHDVYQASGRWTYQGQTTTGCYFHDSVCRNQGDAACFWSAVQIFAGGDLNTFCLSWAPNWWTYDTIVVGQTVNVTHYRTSNERCRRPPQ